MSNLKIFIMERIDFIKEAVFLSGLSIEEVIQAFASDVSIEFLQELGVGNYDVCIVAISDNFQSSLETTSLLKELGAKKVVSRAERDVQAKFLLRNGADEVLYPEKQLAKWAAVRYGSDHLLDYIELDADNAADYLSDADIVCEAFDNAECKAMLAECVLAQFKDKYLVACSGMAGFGSANAITTRRISSRFYLSGDLKSDVNNGIGLVSSRVMLCAAHQAHTILRIIIGLTDV